MIGVDPIARMTKHATNAPSVEANGDELADGLHAAQGSKDRSQILRYSPMTTPSSIVGLKSIARTRMGAIVLLAGWKRT